YAVIWCISGSCCFFFFFSSRRRHTRCLSDWSSDVCSSDLIGAGFLAVKASDLIEKWLGESGRNVAELFARARAHRPVVIFLDERSEERRVGKEWKGGGLGQQ